MMYSSPIFVLAGSSVLTFDGSATLSVPCAETGVADDKAMNATADASAMKAFRMFHSFIDKSDFQR
jgi:hypothetical protein